MVEQWLDESAARISADVEGTSDLDGRLRALWSDSMTPEPDGGDSWLLLEIELWLHAARNAEFAGDLAQRYDDRRAALAAPLAEWAKDEGLGRLRHPQRTSGSSSRCCSARRCSSASTPNAFSTADVVAGLRALIEGDTP